MFEQEFAALKTFRQFLPNRLLDDARPGKSDQRAWFRDIEIAEHGETGGNAAGGRIRQQGNERQLGVIESRQGGRDFRQLHQADGALHHARSAGARYSDKRLTRFER